MAAEWFIFLRGSFHRMAEWEERALEDAIVVGHSVVTYVWSWRQGDEVKEDTYVIDLLAMTQTNETTGAWRRLLRFAKEDSHAVLSPLRPETVICGE